MFYFLFTVMVSTLIKLLQNFVRHQLATWRENLLDTFVIALKLFKTTRTSISFPEGLMKLCKTKFRNILQVILFPILESLALILKKFRFVKFTNFTKFRRNEIFLPLMVNIFYIGKVSYLDQDGSGSRSSSGPDLSIGRRNKIRIYSLSMNLIFHVKAS
jgi:hypothetical protein